MSVGNVGGKRTFVPKKTSTGSSTKVSKTQTQPTTSKKTQPKVQQDTTGKAKLNSSSNTDSMSKLSQGAKMERGARTGGTKPRVGTKKTGETGSTKKTSSTTKGGKTGGTKGRGRTQGLKYRPKSSKTGKTGPPRKRNIKAQDEQGQKEQKLQRRGLSNIKKSNQPQGTKEEQLSRLRSKEGKTGGDSVELKPGRDLQMKEMGEKHKTQEYNQESRKVRLDSGDVEIKDKVWQSGGGAKFGTRTLTDSEKKQSETKFGEKGWDQQGQMNVKLKDGQGKEIKPGERRMFVMDDKGKVNSTKETSEQAKDGTWVTKHHSSLNDGKSVSGAGHLTTRKDGTLSKIDDGSGHYKPGAQQNLQTMRELERKGVAMDNVKFGMVRGREDGKERITTGMVNEYRQGGGSETTFQARHDVQGELKQKMKGVRRELDKQGVERRQDVRSRLKDDYESSAPEHQKELKQQKQEQLEQKKQREQEKLEKRKKETTNLGYQTNYSKENPLRSNTTTDGYSNQSGNVTLNYLNPNTNK